MVLVGMSQVPTEEMVETLTGRPPVEWPGRRYLIQRRKVILTYREGIVLVFVQYLGYGCLIRRHPGIVTRKTQGTVIKIAHMHRMMIAAGKQRSAGRPANSRSVKVGKPHAIIG